MELFEVEKIQFLVEVLKDSLERLQALKDLLVNDTDTDYLQESILTPIEQTETLIQDFETILKMAFVKAPEGDQFKILKKGQFEAVTMAEYLNHVMQYLPPSV